MTCIKTACPYCGVGCGINAVATGERQVEISGDDAHPANAGKLCSKGTHLGETVGLEGRLFYPEIGGERVEWDEALSLTAARFQNAIEQHGPDSVAFYVSGQILTEDYYVANKLMKGFIGSANIDTNSRLCMASAVAAHTRAFGEDVVPVSYSDLEEAELILLVGSNTAWCHPVIWQRIEASRKNTNAKLVVIDPRRTETADCADLHIPIAPDGDTALFNGLLLEMLERGLIDEDYISAHVDLPDGFWAGLSGDVADMGINPDLFAQLTEMVAAHPKMVTLFSMGANQSVGGTDKGNAIINLHLATGRIGKTGSGPFSMTGQPNAMGGREVGGLASMLAAHMGFSEAEKKAAQDFWRSPKIAPAPGLKAVDMFRAVHDGRIKALWVMGTNPAVSMPDAGFVREALDKCEFLVVSDCIAQTDTAAYADVKLPALAWGEKEGMVTNSERVISRQRAIFDAPGEAQPDWWALAEVAKRMGFADAFSFDDPVDVFREFAQQTAFRNDGKRKLNLSLWSDISKAEYADWQPWQWGGTSPFADGQYTHAGRRAKAICTAPAALTTPGTGPEYPLTLNTGRYRDQWHTMTRTGLSPRLSQHRREALLEIHPKDAEKYAIADGGLARISTPHGETIARVSIEEGQRRGEVFLPMHWTDQMGSSGRANLLLGQAVDPISNQPGFKRSAASVAAVKPDWRGFLVTSGSINMPELLYWNKAAVNGGALIELAGQGVIDVDVLLPDGSRLEASDMQRGMRRIAVLDDDGILQAALYITRGGTLPDRDWIASQLSEDNSADGPSLLAGRPREKGPDKGPIVCVCFNVGEKEICSAAKQDSLSNVDAVGQAINAGTNCGSCRPAIAKLLEQVDMATMEAAE